MSAYWTLKGRYIDRCDECMGTFSDRLTGYYNDDDVEASLFFRVQGLASVFGGRGG